MNNTRYGKIGNGKKFHIVDDGKSLCSLKEAKDIVSDVESDNVCKRCQAKAEKETILETRLRMLD